MGEYYVYLWFRIDGSPLYVGKGKGQRWLARNRRHNPQLCRTIAKYGDRLPIVKIRENLDHGAACEIEAALIRAIGRADLGLGPLVNLTDGGDGAPGFRHSEENKTKMKRAWKRRPPASAESRARMSAAGKGRVFTEEHRAKIGAATRRVQTGVKTGPLNPEHRTAISRDLTGIVRANVPPIAFGGRVLTQAQWARETGLSKQVIGYRLRAGWSIERTLKSA